MGSGHPLIFIHGFCETSEVWSGFSDRFAREFLVVNLDLPGFGNSEMPSQDFSIEDIAHQLLNHFKQLGISEYTLIGHSLGGYVALAMANLTPDECKAIVLFHSTPNEDLPERKENRTKVIEFVRQHGVKPFVETLVPGLFKSKSHPGVARVLQMALQTKPETVLAYSKAMRDRPSHRYFLQEFSHPILLLGGEFDPIIPTSSLLEISKESRADLAILKDTAHMAMEEAPAEAYQVLNSFLKNRVYSAKSHGN